jgi:hypothetical protein
MMRSVLGIRMIGTSRRTKHSTVSTNIGVMMMVSMIGKWTILGSHAFVDMRALRTIEWAVEESGAVSTLNTYIV